jgi:hypothetical protein
MSPRSGRESFVRSWRFIRIHTDIVMPAVGVDVPVNEIWLV